MMIDTTRVKQMGIGQHGKKNDAIDAECIARAVEKGQIPEAHVLSVERQRLRHLMMTRRALMESRTTMVTTIRGIATSEGVRFPRCDADDFIAKRYPSWLGMHAVASLDECKGVTKKRLLVF